MINNSARTLLSKVSDIIDNNFESADKYESLKMMILKSYPNAVQEYIKTIYGNDDFMHSQIVWYMVYVVTLTDAYLDLNHKAKLYTISTDERMLFSKLIKAIENETTIDFGKDKNIFKYLIDNSIRMYNAAALDKVEKFKSLGDEDLVFIDKLNPFYKEEYDHFNATINEDFLMRHVDKMFKHTNNLDDAYEYVATFINRIYYINPDELDEIMPKLEEIDDSIEDILFENDIDKLKDIIKSMYEAYENEKKNKNLS